MRTSVKTCFKCETRLPLTEFYKHSQMADGHLNKCKACTKRDVRQHRDSNPEKVRKYDRMRYRRDEYRQRQMRDLAKNIPQERKKVYQLTSNAIRDGRLVRPDGCWHCGEECTPDAHHVYYDPERYMDVTWLCRSCHIKAHKWTRPKEGVAGTDAYIRRLNEGWDDGLLRGL